MNVIKCSSKCDILYIIKIKLANQQGTLYEALLLLSHFLMRMRTFPGLNIVASFWVDSYM